MKQELYSIDSQKWDMLLELLEHPERYSETQKAELLGDEEMNEIYQQMVETRQALDFDKSNEEIKMPSVDEEWKKLKEEKLKSTKVAFLWSPMRKVAAVAAVLVVSGFAFAAIHLVTHSQQSSEKNDTELVASDDNSAQQVPAPQKTYTEEKTDTASIAKLPLVYENAELQNILTPLPNKLGVPPPIYTVSAPAAPISALRASISPLNASTHLDCKSLLVEEKKSQYRHRDLQKGT